MVSAHTLFNITFFGCYEGTVEKRVVDEIELQLEELERIQIKNEKIYRDLLEID